MTDAERQVAYSPSSCTGGTFAPFIAEYETRSENARQRFERSGPPLREIRYGTGPSQTVDLVCPEGADGATPLVVFIHGGYWQLLSKSESLFAAPDCIDNGLAFAAVDYTLAPAATLDEIVTECRQALSALLAACPDAGIDSERIVVCGSSAGGHLSAMVGLGTDDGWRPAAVGLLSGVFELEPLIGTDINTKVGIDLPVAKRNSPMLAELAGFPSALIAWGDIETEEFKLQSRAFGHLLSGQGTPVSLLEVADRNHFDVVLDLCTPRTPLGDAMLHLVASTDTSTETSTETPTETR